MWANRASWSVGKVVVSAAVLLASSCTLSGTKTSALPPSHGAPSFRVECVRLDDCWTAAHRACHGTYRVVSKRDDVNAIPESDLSGLNAQTQGNTARHTTSYGTTVPGGVPSYGPGIESDDPMPLSEVVVVCHAGS
jgi:hypothetical protein